MRKNIMKLAFLIMSTCMIFGFAACNGGDTGYKKPSSNHDFLGEGNYTEPDYSIDGVMNEDAWNDAFTVAYGPNNECTFKIIFGETGLTAGWDVIDAKIEGRENPTLENHINEWADCVELYLDTQNNGGAMPQTDDYQLNINPFEYSRLKVGAGSGWATWTGVVDYAATIDGTPNNDTDEDVGYIIELFLPYSSFGITQDSVIGLSLGYRPCDATGSRSAWYGWELSGNPQIPDNYISINKDGICYDAPNGSTSEEYIVTKGDATDVTVDATGMTIDSEMATWVIDRKTSLPENNKYAISLDVKNVPVADYENGIVPYSALMFGFENEMVNALDEYYMIWIRNDSAGIAYIGEKEDGSYNWVWNSKSLSQNLAGQTVTLDVVRNENVLLLYVNGALHQKLVDDSSAQPNGSFIAYRSEIVGGEFGFVSVEDSSPYENPSYMLFTGVNMVPSLDKSLITSTQETLTVNSTALVWAMPVDVSLPNTDNYTINTKIYDIDSRGNFATLAGVVFGMTETGGEYYYVMLCDIAARIGYWDATGWKTYTTTFSNSLLSGNVDLSITRNGNIIKVYADETCVLVFNDTDTDLPSGRAVAFRSEGATSKYDTLTVTDAVNRFGTFTNNAENTITATATESGVKVNASVVGAETFVIDRTLTLPNADKYTIEGTFTITDGDVPQGFVFGLSTETTYNLDYYFAYVRKTGVGIASTNTSWDWGNIGWANTASPELQSGFDVGATVTVKIVRDGTKISMYVNGYLAKEVTATANRTGLIVGWRVQNIGEINYGNITITDNSVSGNK